MKSVNPFKILFWVLTCIVGVLLIGAVMVVWHDHMTVSTDGPEIFGVWIIAAMSLVVLGIMTLIAVLVYADAKRKGLNPWLWATVAVFVPNLLGVIIYLIVRFTIKQACPACGKGLQGDFRICPYCGNEMALQCRQCGKAVLSDWKVCPHCGVSLAGGEPTSN